MAQIHNRTRLVACSFRVKSYQSAKTGNVGYVACHNKLGSRRSWGASRLREAVYFFFWHEDNSDRPHRALQGLVPGAARRHLRAKIGLVPSISN
jgi:transposase InsO family protein